MSSPTQGMWTCVHGVDGRDWCEECHTPASPGTDHITVTMQVTVTLTPAQREAYGRDRGVDFVALDIAGRVRPEMTEALRQISWLDRYAVVEISDPKATYEHTVG